MSEGSPSAVIALTTKKSYPHSQGTNDDETSSWFHCTLRQQDEEELQLTIELLRSLTSNLLWCYRALASSSTASLLHSTPTILNHSGAS